MKRAGWFYTTFRRRSSIYVICNIYQCLCWLDVRHSSRSYHVMPRQPCLSKHLQLYSVMLLLDSKVWQHVCIWHSLCLSIFEFVFFSCKKNLSTIGTVPTTPTSSTLTCSFDGGKKGHLSIDRNYQYY